MNRRAAGGAGAAILVILGIAYMAATPPRQANQDRYRVTFISGSTLGPDTTAASYGAIMVSPPHWSWEVQKNLYDCKASPLRPFNSEGGSPRIEPVATPESGILWVGAPVDAPGARTRQVMDCEFAIPSEWGCADARMIVRHSYQDPDAEPISTPSGPVNPRITLIVAQDQPPVRFGVCPDPTVAPVVVPEMDFLSGLFFCVVYLVALSRFPQAASRCVPIDEGKRPAASSSLASNGR